MWQEKDVKRKMKYRFLGQPDKMFPNLIHGKIYNLIVVTAFWSRKPVIIRPFRCPYSNWLSFYRNWRPMTIEMFKLENEVEFIENRYKNFINFLADNKKLLTKKQKKIKMKADQ